MRIMAVITLLVVLSQGPLAAAQTGCSDVVNKLRTFTERVNENNYAVANFVGEVSIALDGWYSDYSQFEDQTVAIAPDYFTPLRDAADGIGETVNIAFEQMDILDQEGRDLVDLVETCMNGSSLP